MAEFPNRKIVEKGRRIPSTASRRILAGIKSGPLALSILIFRSCFLTPSAENFISGLHSQGEGGISGKLLRYSSTNTLSYCSRKASALALSEEHTRLLVTKAGIPRDSVLSNFRYDQARLIRLEPAFSGSVSRDSGVKPPITLLRYLSWATRNRLVMILRSRLYLVGWTAFTLWQAFLYARLRLFIKRFTEELTQGRWRFPLDIPCDMKLSVASNVGPVVVHSVSICMFLYFFSFLFSYVINNVFM